MEIFGLAALGLIGGELLKYGKITRGPRPLCIWCSSSSADNVMTAPGPLMDTAESRGLCVNPPTSLQTEPS